METLKPGTICNTLQMVKNHIVNKAKTYPQNFLTTKNAKYIVIRHRNDFISPRRWSRSSTPPGSRSPTPGITAFSVPSTSTASPRPKIFHLSHVIHVNQRPQHGSRAWLLSTDLWFTRFRVSFPVKLWYPHNFHDKKRKYIVNLAQKCFISQRWSRSSTPAGSPSPSPGITASSVPSASSASSAASPRPKSFRLSHMIHVNQRSEDFVTEQTSRVFQQGIRKGRLTLQRKY